MRSVIQDPTDICPSCHQDGICNDDCSKVKKHYRIMGNYQRSTEEIDHADDEKEALRLQGEYQIAFGKDWSIWVEVQNIVDGVLNNVYPLQS